MTDGINPATPFQGPSSVAHTTHQEAAAQLAADGQTAAPAGTTPVPVNPGDTISELMANARPPLDWNNPRDRAQFLADNPQFSETGDRNPDLIWPGEVLYIRSGSTQPTLGGEPPTNGTHAVGGPDEQGNYTYRNYVNGQPTGPQYDAQPGENGQPANSVIISPQGGEIRTGANGAPLTGWAPLGSTTSDGGQPYVYYVNGMPTTERRLVASGGDAPVEAPAPATGNDASGVPYSTDGWRITADSSQGVAQHYYVNGYQIDSPQVVNGNSDGPPPIIQPGSDAQLAAEEFSGEVSETVQTPDSTYQTVTKTYANGELVATERGPEFE